MINIAIDGPAGSGKTTVAKQISKILDILYLDTGAMYRCVAVECINKKIKPDELDKIEKILERIKKNFISILKEKNQTEFLRDIKE